MNAAITFNPSEVAEVLIKGESEWLPVKSMSQSYWRLDDGSTSSRGRRGWVIVTTDGERIAVGVEAIEGVR
jgi:hypothetical protein